MGFSKHAHTQSTLAYLQELLTLGVAKMAHSNPVKRNSETSLRQLNHFPAQGRQARKEGKNLGKYIIGIIKMLLQLGFLHSSH